MISNACATGTGDESCASASAFPSHDKSTGRCATERGFLVLELDTARRSRLTVTLPYLASALGQPQVP